MFENKSIAVVVPCYNEETQIERVLSSLPDFVDCAILVDDCSRDKTIEVAKRYARAHGMDDRVVILRQEVNQGQGAAVVVGYQEVIRRGFDIAVVVDGDGQMDFTELPLLLAPITRGEADYSKGNRLSYRGAWQAIPRHRFLGNAFLSMLTKIASGYWHVADSQSAYTAISREALEAIDLDGIYPRFGYPNDILVRLNVVEMRVANVKIRPIYNIGEKSKMRLLKVVPTMSWLIAKRFLWRLWHKYVIRDFHPLVLFYLAGALLATAGLGASIRILWMWFEHGRIPPLNALIWVFCMVSSAQFSLFAMWFDMEMNRDLKVRLSEKDYIALPKAAERVRLQPRRKAEGQPAEVPQYQPVDG